MSRSSSRLALIAIAAIHASSAEAQSAHADHILHQPNAFFIPLPTPRSPGAGLNDNPRLVRGTPRGKTAGPVTGLEPLQASKPVGVAAPPSPAYVESPSSDLRERDAADGTRGAVPPGGMPASEAFRERPPVFVTLGRDPDTRPKPPHRPTWETFPPRPPVPVSRH